MAGHDSTEGAGLTAINITPMVDIMLVLLVIFMVTTTAMQTPEGIAIDRPDAATGDALQQRGTPLVITCPAEGELAIDGVALVDDGEVGEVLARRVAADPRLSAIVDCDESRPVRVLVHVLDLLRAAGVRDYAVATETPQPGERT